MTSIRIRRIRQITDSETDQIVEMLLRAYVDNTAVPPMIGGREELRDLLFRSMVRAGGLDGDLRVVENENGDILSMSLWFEPGVMMWGTEEQRKLGYNELMEKLDKETISWWKNDYPKATGDFIKGWLPVPRSEIWWLNILGTDPEHQRKGYASMLLNDVVNSIKGHTTLAFCSTTEENAEFYRNAGFPIRGRTQVPSKQGSFLIIGHSRDL